MYTLRIIEKDGSIQNFYLGNSYKRLDHKTPAYKEIVRESYPDILTDKIPCIVLSGASYIIHEDQRAYIVSENGNTFEKLR